MHRFATSLLLFTLTLSTLCLSSAQALGNGEFPLRPYYPEIPVITTDELLAAYDDAVILDIRSGFEYGVARINKAILLPITDHKFADKLEKIRAKDGTAAIAFYCNGHTCAKSYQAAQKAISLGFKNVYVYDGGIFDWIDVAPHLATLMNETPARTNRIIAADQFNRRLMDYTAFANAATHRDALVIDIRDPFQREMVPLIKNIRNIPLDSLLEMVVSRVWTEKRLLFFDAVGKQVRWLQYFLESNGYHDYAFLKGGIRAAATDRANVRPAVSEGHIFTTHQDALLAVLRDTRLNNNERTVLNYLVANVKFNNYSVVDIKKTTAVLHIDRKTLVKVTKRLAGLGYINHTLMQNSLVVQIDPRLAWKGEPRGRLWEDKLKDFPNTQHPQGLGICNDGCD